MKGLAPGQVMFGRYRLRMLLGAGGMAVVWLAYDEELEIEIALKFLAEGLSNDVEALRELKRETKRGMMLAHPHVVRIFGFHHANGRAAIAMEYVEGANLDDLKGTRDGGYLEVPEIRDWVAQLCAGLDYAHRDAGIVHRDLKPSNLMIDRAGRLKITDLGIAGTLRDSTTRRSQREDLRGTPAFMSPQQMLGQRPCVSHDIYSLGATVYALLTGAPPFFEGNLPIQVKEAVPPPMVRRRLERGVSEGGAIPVEWEETIAACLSKDAAKRPASAGEVAERLGCGADAEVSVGQGKRVRVFPAMTAGDFPTVAMPDPAPTQKESAAPAVPVLNEATAVEEPAPVDKRSAAPRRPTVFAVVAVLVAVGLLAGLLGGLLASKAGTAEGKPPAQPVAMADESVVAMAGTDIAIETHPSGARVEVAEIGQFIAPFQLVNVGRATLEAVVSKPGYRTREVSFPLAGGSISRSIDLLPAEGWISIHSERLTGARVLIEPESLEVPGLAVPEQRGRTPFRSRNLPVGRYRVAVEDPRGELWPGYAASVAVPADQTVEVEVAFPEGILTVHSRNEQQTYRLLHNQTVIHEGRSGESVRLPPDRDFKIFATVDEEDRVWAIQLKNGESKTIDLDLRLAGS